MIQLAFGSPTRRHEGYFATPLRRNSRIPVSIVNLGMGLLISVGLLAGATMSRADNITASESVKPPEGVEIVALPDVINRVDLIGNGPVDYVVKARLGSHGYPATVFNYYFIVDEQRKSHLQTRREIDDFQYVMMPMHDDGKDNIYTNTVVSSATYECWIRTATLYKRTVGGITSTYLLALYIEENMDRHVEKNKKKNIVMSKYLLIKSADINSAKPKYYFLLIGRRTVHAPYCEVGDAHNEVEKFIGEPHVQ